MQYKSQGPHSQIQSTIVAFRAGGSLRLGIRNFGLDQGGHYFYRDDSWQKNEKQPILVFLRGPIGPKTEPPATDGESKTNAHRSANSRANGSWRTPGPAKNE